MISLVQLKVHLVTYPEAPPRTTALEQKLQIGTGFHGKWYRSQREHWLGWIVVQECQARGRGAEPSKTDAGAVWSRLKCSPMMFWLAECSGVSPTILDEAEEQAFEASKLNSKDGSPHGKMIRSVLPWPIVSSAINERTAPSSSLQADALADQAFARLTELVPAYRSHRAFRISPQGQSS